MIVSVVVGFRNTSISTLDGFRIMRSRNLIHTLLSCGGLSFMYVCIWFIYYN